MVGCNSYSGGFNLKPIFILVCLIVFITIGLGISHAIERHNLDSPVEAIRSKCDNPQSHLNYRIDQSRFIQVCQLNTGEISFRVIEKIGSKYEEITTYVKNNLKNWSDVNKFMSDKGYVRIKVLP